MQKSYSKIMVSCIVTSETIQDVKNSFAYKFMSEALDEFHIKEILTMKLDEIIVQLICRVSDNANFSYLNMCYVLLEFKKETLDMQKFKKSLELVFNLNEESMFSYFLKYPSKLQNILLNLCLRIHKCYGLHEKVRAFQQYTIFVDLLTPFIKAEGVKLKEFIARDVTYFLLHLIEKKYESNILNVISVEYLKKFLMEILHFCKEFLNKIFVELISIVSIIAKNDDNLGFECLDLLNYLLIENKDYFMEMIPILDPFSTEEKFQKINDVCKGIHFHKAPTLKQEIERFLLASKYIKDAKYRLEGLKHLRLQLNQKKSDLKRIYEELSGARRFSEDCEKSILHQLICNLVRFTSSADINVSFFVNYF